MAALCFINLFISYKIIYKIDIRFSAKVSIALKINVYILLLVRRLTHYVVVSFFFLFNAKEPNIFFFKK